MADEKTSAQEKTRVRKPADNSGDQEATRPLEPYTARKPRTTSATRYHFGRWLALAAAGAGAGVLAALWWWSGDQELPPDEPAPMEVTPPQIAEPEAVAPAAESDSDFRHRLERLDDQPPSTLSAMERDQLLDGLFEAFENALAAGNLILPATDSASEYLLRMTALGPEHPKVLEARSLLAHSFLERSREARLAGRWEEADRYLQYAVDVRIGPAERETDSPAD